MNQRTSFRHLLLLLQLVLLLPGITQGKEVVLGKEGDSVELPCKAPQLKRFTWKQPSGIMILGRYSLHGGIVKGESKLKNRVESRTSLWEQGSYPLIISKLEITDSGTYVCDVENKATEVELMVFGLRSSLNMLTLSSIRLLDGKNLTLTVENPSKINPSVEWKGPGNKKRGGGKSLSLSQLGVQDSGTWTCTVSYDKKKLVLNINIFVLAFQKVSGTFYANVGKPAVFSFPLTFDDENLKGELSWQEKGSSSLQSWITFSLENRKVSVIKDPQDRKLQAKEMLPLSFTLPKASPQDAGSGFLTLSLTQGQLRQDVNLVVMRMTKSQDQLTCEVLGPASSELILSLKLNNQSVEVSKQKLVKLLNPKTGRWQCLLSDKNRVLLESEVEVLSSTLTPSGSKLLAIVLGAITGFLIFTGFFIFCCVKCWRRRRQAERMSQIKRLLSEKKTCQCPHRLQKTRNLI